jgi:AAA domain
MAERWLRHEPDFLVRLDSKLYNAWNEAVAADKRPQLVWRQGSGLQVRGYGQGSTTSTNQDTSTNSSPGSNPSAGNKKSAPRFKLLRYCDLRPGVGDQDYLIDELLPVEGIVMVWGKFKCLKTFLMYDMMLHVAKGWEYRERATQQGLVVYCAFEGAHGFPKRTEAQRRHYKLADDDNVPLRVMACPTNLIKDHLRLVADIRDQLAPDENPAVIVLDTLNRSLIGSESKDADMAAYIFAASAIRVAFKCLVIVIHHCGWDETRPRGHSSLPGAVDGQLAVVRDGDTVTMQVEFLRDGPEGTEIHNAVKVVEVGQDVTGKVLTSLVVVAANRAAQSNIRPWPKSLSVLRRAVKTALAAHGEDFQEKVLSLPVRAVSLDLVRDEYYATYPAKGDTLEQRQDNKKHAFARAIAKAQELDLIRLREVASGGMTMVWWASADAT